MTTKRRDKAAIEVIEDVVSTFHPVIQTWFRRRFEAPTDAQAAGWPQIQSGRDALIAAPTGSGKTLAAFLCGIDALVKQAEAGDLAATRRRSSTSRRSRRSATTSSATSRRRWQELAEVAADLGTLSAARCPAWRLAEIRVGLRTGDTPQKDRQAYRQDAAAHPDHDARVALPDAHGRPRPRDPAQRPHRHRRRDPRPGARQARQPPLALARPPRPRLRAAARPHRPLAPRSARSRRLRPSSSAPSTYAPQCLPLRLASMS